MRPAAASRLRVTPAGRAPLRKPITSSFQNGGRITWRIPLSAMASMGGKFPPAVLARAHRSRPTTLRTDGGRIAGSKCSSRTKRAKAWLGSRQQAPKVGTMADNDHRGDEGAQADYRRRVRKNPEG